ncbi:hypothetical protein Leryth_024666 [Lithospermum erythrorhizon]|nr:hypothetical protein Leryth_024666 [Lithospermum erythrorhizon]
MALLINCFKRPKIILDKHYFGCNFMPSALLATDYSQGNYNQARKVVYKVLQIGLLMGGSMAIILFISFGALSGLFSTDSDVLQASRSGTLVRRPYLD